MIRLNGQPRPTDAPPSVARAAQAVSVDARVCHACGACVAVCPPDALFLSDTRLGIDGARCTGCRRCVTVCPVGALVMAQESHAVGV